jgi:hypothetical protein
VERDRRDQGEFDSDGSTVLAAAGTGTAATFSGEGIREEQPHAKYFLLSIGAQ